MKKAGFAVFATLLFGIGLVNGQPLPLPAGPHSPAADPTQDSPRGNSHEAVPAGPVLPPPRQYPGPTLGTSPAPSDQLNGAGPVVVPDGPGLLGWRWTGPGIAHDAVGPWTGPGVAHDGAVAGIDADPAEFAQSQERPGSYRLWGGVETLFCWESKQLLPPGLVTTGVPSDARPGALGQPNTQVVFGPSDLSYGMFAGVRAVAGLWLDDGQVIGLEASGFLLEDRGQGFPARSTAGGSPLLALSRFDAPVGSADAAVITTPPGPDGRTSSYTGGIALSTDSQVWGSAVTLLHPLYWSRSFRLLVLGGLDYLDLRENLDMGTQKTGRGTSLVSFLGQRFDSQASVLTSDSFHVRSQFYGGQTGLRGEYILDRVYVSAAASLAVGRTDEAANVLGVSELLRKNAVPQTAPGGLYALPSNSGRFSDSDVGVIPEVQVKGGVLLQPWLRATVGYDFLYWNRVLRAGDQLDLNVDPRQVPTDPSFKSGIAATAPRPLTNRTDFWMQGLTFGLEITY